MSSYVAPAPRTSEPSLGMGAISLRSRYVQYYESQTVFLTGGTGGLGTCLLYKLGMELPTTKIYVLIRSKEKALQTWRKFIPDQIDAMLDSSKIVLVTGDIGRANLGIEEKILAKIASDATIIINSAANTSFSTATLQAVKENCFSALELARLATSFTHLKHFIQISTIYCNAFLRPPTTIAEKIYPIYDPESELRDILMTGTSPHAAHFPWPYAHSKHLSEQLLLSQFSQLPILIVRPSCIGSAISSPYAGYGPVKSTPIEMFWRVHTLNPGDRVFHTPPGCISGTNIWDEIPVDWVSNLLLLHIAADTRGVVHASAASFVSKTFDEFRELYKGKDDKDLVWVKDRSKKQCKAPEFYKVVTGNWTFEGTRSEWCEGVKDAGPLSVCVGDVDLPAYDKLRKKKVRADIDAAIERVRVKKSLVKRNSKL